MKTKRTPAKNALRFIISDFFKAYPGARNLDGLAHDFQIFARMEAKNYRLTLAQRQELSARITNLTARAQKIGA